MECSVIHHVVIVLLFLWVLSYLNRSHALFYFLSLVYLYLVCYSFSGDMFLLGVKASNLSDLVKNIVLVGFF